MIHPLAALALALASILAVPSSLAATQSTDDLPRRAGPMGVRLEDLPGGGVGIAEVVPGTPAAKAGVAGGSRIVSLNGTPIALREDLPKAMRGVMAGATVQLETRVDDGPPRTFAIPLEAMAESLPGHSVRYGSVRVPDGYRLRTIVTEPDPGTSPLAKDGRLPAVLYVQGIICQSIDQPSFPEAPDTRILHALAGAGFITMRVDKPGMGDSEGPPCSEIDLETELEGFEAALRQLAAMPQVDPDRLYIFGHSMGGVLAPYLSAAVPVRGTVVYGTLARTWFEYQLENVRRQAALQPGVREADITDAVLAEAKVSSTVLVDKKTLGDAWARWPELRREPQGLMLDENHMSTRSMAFFHQLQDLNLARAWERSTGAVLAVYGEYDWVTSQGDHEMIARIVNARTPGAGTAIVMPKADHAFTRHDSLAASVTAMGAGEWDADFPKRMIEWIAGLEAGERAAAPTPAPAWTKLPTEPYPGKQDDIFFVDDRTGWYGNGAGKLFRTADGGDTWTKVWERPGTFVRCLAFVDAKVGVLGNVGPGYFPGVTDPVPVYRTDDGGTTWTPATSIEGDPVAGLCAFDVVDVSFVNAGRLDRRPRIIGVGRVGGPAAFIQSDDLGKTWTRRPLPEIAAMAFDVRFLDEKRGFLAAATDADVAKANALILATEDGGDTWREVYRSTRPFELTWKFSFPDATTGYCTIQSYDPDPAASRRFVAKTVDGGRTWSEIPLVDDARVRAFGIAFTDAEHGWVGAMPHGFATTDGGLTWTRADFGNAVNKIRLVRTAEGVTGYAIGVDVHRLRQPNP